MTERHHVDVETYKEMDRRITELRAAGWTIGVVENVQRGSIAKPSSRSLMMIFWTMPAIRINFSKP